MSQNISIATQISLRLSEPILAPLLNSRPIGLIVLGAVGLHSGLVMLGLPGWQCPIRHGLGIPCPGCGLSRALVALLQGDWPTSLTYHAFAPLFLIGLLVLAVATLLPAIQRNHLINRVERLERGTGVVSIILVALVFYWLMRLFIFRQAFINLIMG